MNPPALKHPWVFLFPLGLFVPTGFGEHPAALLPHPWAGGDPVLSPTFPLLPQDHCPCAELLQPADPR